MEKSHVPAAACCGDPRHRAGGARDQDYTRVLLWALERSEHSMLPVEERAWREVRTYSPKVAPSNPAHYVKTLGLPTYPEGITAFGAVDVALYRVSIPRDVRLGRAGAGT